MPQDNLQDDLAEQSLRVFLDLLDRGTADGVAAFLAAVGVKGTRLDSASCPVAAYLDSRVDGADVTVGPDQAWLCEDTSRARRVPLPDSVQAFVRAFDSGAEQRWPELHATARTP